MQLSHEKNLPLFGMARVSCHGACRCACKWSHHGAFNASCIYDGLAPGHGAGATVTAFVRMAAKQVPVPTGGADDDNASAAANAAACARDQCAVHIASVRDDAATAERAERARVLVRALIVGYEHHFSTKWLNTHHLDAAGLSSYRRRRARHRLL